MKLEELGTPDRALITSISVEGLFGRYSYQLDVPQANDSRLVLVHGSNGTGKTTVLKLIWNVLSSADDKGHRTQIARVPFKRLIITFADGSVLTCRKKDDLLGDFEIVVKRRGEPMAVAQYVVSDGAIVPNQDERRRSIQVGHKRDKAGWRVVDMLPGMEVVDEPDGDAIYLAFLEEMGFMPLFLADDRTLYSDDEEIARQRERFARQEEERFMRGGRHLLHTRSSDLAAAELRMTLRRLTDWSRQLTLGGQNTGSAGANSIYRDVLVQLASNASPGASNLSSPDDLMMAVAEAGNASARFEEFDLVPSFPSEEYLLLLSQLRSQGGEKLLLAQQILSPYLASLQTRFSALEELEAVVRKLVSLLNDFLEEKTVGFNPASGLMIFTPSGEPLDPTSLSSGERQLVMLFCTAVLARRNSRLFIIDEPELSLGVKWQRKLIDALLSLTEGTPMQLIVATHSIEISSGNPEALVGLK